jgi:hypothetical protein
VGIEEYVDLDLDEFQRRTNERLLALVERSRATIERDLGSSFAVAEHAGRIELTVRGEPVYVASATSSGRLLLTDVSGRYSSRL